MTVGFSVKVSGPIFQPGLNGKVEASLNEAINEIMLRSEAEATQMAQPAPGGLFHPREYAAAHHYFQTGNYSRSINGRMVASLHGVVSDSNAVYGPWLEGVSSRNQTTRFKGYAIFRKTAQKIGKIAGDVLGKHIGKLTKVLD